MSAAAPAPDAEVRAALEALGKRRLVLAIHDVWASTKARFAGDARCHGALGSAPAPSPRRRSRRYLAECAGIVTRTHDVDTSSH